MERPNVHTKPLCGDRDNYHPADWYENQFAKDLSKYADYLEEQIKKDNTELLTSFLVYLNEKGLINNHDFDFEKEAKKYISINKKK